MIGTMNWSIHEGIVELNRAEPELLAEIELEEEAFAGIIDRISDPLDLILLSGRIRGIPCQVMIDADGEGIVGRVFYDPSIIREVSKTA